MPAVTTKHFLALLLGIASSPHGSLAHSMRASSTNDPPTTSSTRELLVGGSGAAEGEFPYFATLIAADGTIRCGGTLISSTKVLTAGT
jgi:secreted trypsin-like serine protease